MAEYNARLRKSRVILIGKEILLIRYSLSLQLVVSVAPNAFLDLE